VHHPVTSSTSHEGRLPERQLRRRTLVLLAAISAVPCLPRAQPSRHKRRLGFLAPPVADSDGHELFGMLRSEMERLGWVEGSGIEYVIRVAGGSGTPESKLARLATMAQELVAAKVDVIVAMSTKSAQAAKRATSAIPVVFLAERPVENGLVTSLAQPGGNVTGVTYHIDSLLAKRMQLLKQAFPRIRTMGYLAPTGPSVLDAYRDAEIVAKELDVQVVLVQVEHVADVEAAVRAAPNVDSWIVEDWTVLAEQGDRVVGWIAGSRKPAVYGAIDWVEAGGLMSYSDDRGDWPRRLAAVADRILRGAKPSELPVEEPARFVLGINQKTARALALTIPSSVLLQASKVIE
jgi:putative ABC transport system substrate-binding protein